MYGTVTPNIFSRNTTKYITIIPSVAAITPVRNLSVTFTTRVAYNTNIANRIEIVSNTAFKTIESPNFIV